MPEKTVKYFIPYMALKIKIVLIHEIRVRQSDKILISTMMLFRIKSIVLGEKVNM